MALWIDKHCPRRIEDLQCHPQITSLLRKLSERSDVPHLLFYGPSGAGKTTRILTLLREIFGDNIDKVKAEKFSGKESNLDMFFCQSPHHMLLPCPDLGLKDRVIVQEVIKDLSSTVGAFSFFNKGPKYRVFIFQDAEALSEGAQAGLRRTLEKYVKNARVFLHVQSLSSIILPLRSRFLCIRVPLPGIEEIVGVLRGICVKENLKTSDSFLQKIAEKSQRNLRRSILNLESAAMSPAIESFTQWNLPWELYVSKICDIIVEKQAPKVLGECRDMVYDLLACCIPGELVLEYMAKTLIADPRVLSTAKPSIMHAAAYFSHTMKLGKKEIWHIEAFIAMAMCDIKAGDLLRVK